MCKGSYRTGHSYTGYIQCPICSKSLYVGKTPVTRTTVKMASWSLGLPSGPLFLPETTTTYEDGYVQVPYH